ncbi:benzoate 4-monooxygenase cytochrome p450 [Apiospora arundinis]|uniref:Benzoate 4-monooxygenase cytochrome p450 n=1 Tax=Apiospora arundinis TaxID=335852 RepID=A0ABR2HRA2_9PEZI
MARSSASILRSSTIARRLCDKMLRCRKQCPIDVSEAYNCFTADTISQCAFGQPLGFLNQEGWRPNSKAAFHAFLNSPFLFRFVPVVRNLAHLAPYLTRYMGGDMRLLMDEMTAKLPGHVERAMHDRENGRMFAEILDSQDLPDSEKTVYRLTGEGFSLMSAGTETTATAITMITYYMLANPDKLVRLRTELRDADPKNLK